MYLEDESFDAVITDKKGRTIEVDCRVTEPAASGLPASISIEIPLSDREQGDLENPCMLRGADGGLAIEIKELLYRSIPSGVTRRKHARGTFDIHHAGHLWVRRSHWTSERAKLHFLLSPARFFKTHSKAVMVNYLATPGKTVELFKLQTTELGEIRFIKFWAVHHVDKNGVVAEVRASYAAEILYDETTAIPVEQLVKKMKAVLVPLSILTRQAITLHGWEWQKREGIETMWFNPLDPNLAPDMAEEPVENVCFPQEFDTCAQELVENFLRAPDDVQEAITLISVALAPHVPRSTAGNFSALFGALEQVIALKKLTKEEREKLRASDAEVIAALRDLKGRIEATSSPNAVSVAARIEGFTKSVAGSRPSFNVRFEKFQAAYPALAIYMSDLWPLQGTEKLPGLKQIRDSLAHGLQQAYSAQAIAVAHWHFARLAERLTFIMLGIEVPRGLRFDSLLLSRDSWYARSEWEAVRAAAKNKD